MSNIELLHKVDLEIVKEVVNICNKNNLTYYMLGGTMLGAIRHKGFIPWDDDIDLGMPRDSYEKFLQIAPELLSEKLKIVNYRTNPEYHYYITRILDSDTIVEEERIGNDNKYTNASIDIFPIDGTPNNKILRKIYFFRVLYHRALMSLCYKDSIDRKRPRGRAEGTLLWIMERIPVEKITTPYKQKCKIDKLLRKQKIEGSEFIGNIMGAYRTKEIVPTSYYGTGEMYQFEDIQLRGMKLYDEYLTHTYGDYMKLPPENKRKIHFKIIEIHGNRIDTNGDNTDSKIKVLLVDQIGHKTYEYDYAAAQNYSNIYDVTCYVSDNTPTDVPINGFKVKYGFHNVYSGSKIAKGLKYIKALIELRYYIKKNKFDIVNLQWYDLPVADIWFIKSIKKLKKPTPKVILTVHGIIPKEKDEKKHNSLQKVYHHADAILLHSEQGLKFFNDCFETKCGKYMITSAFRDESEYKPIPKEEARKILGIPKEKKVFLSFGTIREDKTIDIFYKAFLESSKRNKEAFLLSAGTLNVKNKEYYIKLAEQCKKTGNAKIDFDYISKEMEPIYYSAADALVLPYSYISQSGVAYCGLLFNLPMIGTRIDRLDIMLKEGRNGEMFDPGDYIQLSKIMDELTTDAVKLAKYREGSIQIRNEDFSIKNRVRFTEKAYRDLLSEDN